WQRASRERKGSATQRRQRVRRQGWRHSLLQIQRVEHRETTALFRTHTTLSSRLKHSDIMRCAAERPAASATVVILLVILPLSWNPREGHAPLRPRHSPLDTSQEPERARAHEQQRARFRCLAHKDVRLWFGIRQDLHVVEVEKGLIDTSPGGDGM